MLNFLLWNCCFDFLTEKKKKRSFFLLIIQLCPNRKKIHRTSKREKFHWKTSLCHWTTFHSYFIERKKIFITHTDQCVFSSFQTNDFTFSYWKTNIDQIFSISHNESSFHLEEKSNLVILFQVTQRKKSCLFIASISFSLDKKKDKKRSHCSKKIFFYNNIKFIFFLFKSNTTPTKFFFFTLSTQTKIISLSNENSFTQHFQSKYFHGQKTSMKSWRKKKNPSNPIENSIVHFACFFIKQINSFCFSYICRKYQRKWLKWFFDK